MYQSTFLIISYGLRVGLDLARERDGEHDMSTLDRRTLLGTGAALSVMAGTVGTKAKAMLIESGSKHVDNDLIVVGGSFAGMSAALNLGRAGRKVLLLDAGQPRNRFANESHGVLGADGTDPAQFLKNARAQLLKYPSIRFQNGLVTGVEKKERCLSVSTREGDVFHARRLLLASGVNDILPEVEGMMERWGQTVLHCPYCHGYEFTGRPTGIFANGPISLHQALLIADWGPVTLFTNSIIDLDDAAKARLAARNVAIEESPIKALRGDGTALEAVQLEDGRHVALNVLYIASQVHLSNAWIEKMGCQIVQGPLGPIVKTDEKQATSVEHVYAAGDCARQPHNIVFACEDGVTAAGAIHMSLIEEEIMQTLENASAPAIGHEGLR